jgi:hypothetical protein
MPIRSFTTVPIDTRDWGRFFRETEVTADVVAPNTVDTAMLVDGAVTGSKLRDSAALSVIGRPVNSAGDPSDITAAVDTTLLRRSGAVVDFGKITSAYTSDFTEAAQDAVGSVLASTATIALVYADATPEVTASVVADSIDNTLLANMAQATVKGRAFGAGSGDPTDLSAAQQQTILGNGSSPGIYTPTITNDTNVDSSTSQTCRFIRVGDQVFVSGAVTVDATAAAATEVGISLPVASNFSALTDCAGAAAANAIQQSGAIFADPTNDRARLQFLATSTASQVMWFTFAYTVI